MVTTYGLNNKLNWRDSRMKHWDPLDRLQVWLCACYILLFIALVIKGL